MNWNSDFKGKVKTKNNNKNIEVRDSWTGYLVPGRDGPELLPDWESCWDAVVDAVAVTWKFRLTFLPGNYIWSFQICFLLIWEPSEFWYRGSTQNFEPDLSSSVVWPGEPIRKTCRFSFYFQNWHVHVVGSTMNIHLLSTFLKCSNDHISRFHASQIQNLEKSQNQ